MSDYLMRQIEDMTRFLAQVLLRRQPDTVQIVDEEGQFSQSGFLEYQVKKLLAQGDVNGAENLLFQVIEADPAACYLPVALAFYEDLAGMSEEQLAAANFSREEICDGLAQIKRIYDE